MRLTYVMMRFYEAGGLATYKVVCCEEDDLIDHLIKFEESCVSQNLGTRIGILDITEFEAIRKDIIK
jgi:hypothetical protein